MGARIPASHRNHYYSDVAKHSLVMTQDELKALVGQACGSGAAAAPASGAAAAPASGAAEAAAAGPQVPLLGTLHDNPAPGCLGSSAPCLVVGGGTVGLDRRKPPPLPRVPGGLIPRTRGRGCDRGRRERSRGRR